jgi:hypothetical protein
MRAAASGGDDARMRDRWIGLGFAIGSVCFWAASTASQWSSVTRPGIGVTFFAGSIFFTGAAYLQTREEHDDASLIQFAGTIFFNVSTFEAMKRGFDTKETDLRVWTPNVFGSICFLVSSWMAWHPERNRINALNLLGSVAFGVSAGAAFVEPSGDEPLNAAIANAMTSLGAVCFLAGAVILYRQATSTPSTGTVGA